MLNDVASNQPGDLNPYAVPSGPEETAKGSMKDGRKHFCKKGINDIFFFGIARKDELS
jgi:hypothetical protein